MSTVYIYIYTHTHMSHIYNIILYIYIYDDDVRTHPSRKHQDLAPPPACSLPNPVAGRFEDMALH